MHACVATVLPWALPRRGWCCVKMLTCVADGVKMLTQEGVDEEDTEEKLAEQRLDTYFTCLLHVGSR